MTKKTIGYVKLAWTCPHCDGENHGPRKFCNGCGAPQPQDVEFHQAAGDTLASIEGSTYTLEAALISSSLASIVLGFSSNILYASS